MSTADLIKGKNYTAEYLCIFLYNIRDTTKIIRDNVQIIRDNPNQNSAKTLFFVYRIQYLIF